MKLPFTTPVEIETSLSRAEIVDRLKNSIDEPSVFFPLFGPTGLVGRVGPERCWFENGSLFSKSNRRLTLYYIEFPIGTNLKGYFAIPLIQLLPILGIFLIGSILCLDEFAGLITHRGSWKNADLIFQLIPLGMLLLVPGMVKLNLWFGRRREQQLVETLTDLLEAPPRSGIAGSDIAQPTGGILIRPRHEQP